MPRLHVSVTHLTAFLSALPQITIYLAHSLPVEVDETQSMTVNGVVTIKEVTKMAKRVIKARLAELRLPRSFKRNLSVPDEAFGWVTAKGEIYKTNPSLKTQLRNVCSISKAVLFSRKMFLLNAIARSDPSEDIKEIENRVNSIWHTLQTKPASLAMHIVRGTKNGKVNGGGGDRKRERERWSVYWNEVAHA